MMLRKLLLAVLAVLVLLSAAGYLLVQRWCATPYGRLDPRVAVYLKLTGAAAERAAEANLPVAESRRRLAEKAASVGGKPLPMASVNDMQAEAEGLSVPVRVYRPESGGVLPVVLFFHGGGWIQGGLDTHDGLCRIIARKSGALVVAVEYRLAPEHPFPAAVDDAYAVLRWVSASGTLLAADPSRIAVAGDSAGGNLAAAVCLMARDRGGPNVALQVLIYPALDAAHLDTASYGMFATGYGLDRANMERFIGMYLPLPDNRKAPYASPLLAGDHGGLPPALILTAAFDVLRDEGEAYGERLAAAGGAVRAIRYPGMIHGFVSADRLLVQARQATDEIAAALRSAFARKTL